MVNSWVPLIAGTKATPLIALGVGDTVDHGLVLARLPPLMDTRSRC
jgi:hypothetical protein